MVKLFSSDNSERQPVLGFRITDLSGFVKQQIGRKPQCLLPGWETGSTSAQVSRSFIQRSSQDRGWSFQTISFSYQAQPQVELARHSRPKILWELVSPQLARLVAQSDSGTGDWNLRLALESDPPRSFVQPSPGSGWTSHPGSGFSDLPEREEQQHLQSGKRNCGKLSLVQITHSYRFIFILPLNL